MLSSPFSSPSFHPPGGKEVWGESDCIYRRERESCLLIYFLHPPTPGAHSFPLPHPLPTPPSPPAPGGVG